MATKITMQADGTLSVPDEPIIPFVEGDGTGVDIWPAAQLVMDAAAAKHGKKIAWTEVLAGEKAFNATGSWLPDETVDVVPRAPDRDQRSAHHSGRRWDPLAERRTPPDPRPLRVPAAGAVVRGRAVAGEAPRTRRHGDLPGEHRRHLRGPRSRGRNARGGEADRDAEGELRLEHPRRLGHRNQAGVDHGFEAPDPRRDQVRSRSRPQVGHARAQGEHPEVHRGSVPQLGLRPREAKSSPTSPSVGTTATASPATRSS